MEGFRRVVLGSAVGGLLGAASFFAVDGLMPREANANPFANLTDLEMQDAWVHVVVWGQTCLALAGHVEVEEVEDRIFRFLKSLLGRFLSHRFLTHSHELEQVPLKMQIEILALKRCCEHPLGISRITVRRRLATA